MAVTKTLGPLHLEDIEPHRFEALIRQLFERAGQPPFADYYFHSLQANKHLSPIEPSPETRISFFERETLDGYRPVSAGTV